MVLRIGRGVSLTRAPSDDAEVSIQTKDGGDGSNGFGNSGHTTWLGSDGSSGGDAGVAVPRGHGHSQNLRGRASQVDGAVGLRVGARARLVVGQHSVSEPPMRLNGGANRLGSVGRGAARASCAALDARARDGPPNFIATHAMQSVGASDGLWKAVTAPSAAVADGAERVGVVGNGALPSSLGTAPDVRVRVGPLAAMLAAMRASGVKLRAELDAPRGAATSTAAAAAASLMAPPARGQLGSSAMSDGGVSTSSGGPSCVVGRRVCLRLGIVTHPGGWVHGCVCFALVVNGYMVGAFKVYWR